MKEYKWEQTIFNPEELHGGDYLVKEGHNKLKSPHFSDSGYLSTVMVKVGWTHLPPGSPGYPESQVCLIDMSDGLVKLGFFISKDAEGKALPHEQWKYVQFCAEKNIEAKAILCDYLNNNIHGETYRKATHEEVMRVILHQKWRVA